MNPIILNDNNHIITAQSIFGKDANKVMSIVKSLYDRYMHPFEHNYPRLSDYGTNIHEFRYWKEHFPEEYSEYCSAKKNWEAEDDKLLRKLYGIVKRRHINIKWLKNSSTCMPDRFLIYKNGKDIGMIQC